MIRLGVPEKIEDRLWIIDVKFVGIDKYYWTWRLVLASYEYL